MLIELVMNAAGRDKRWRPDAVGFNTSPPHAGHRPPAPQPHRASPTPLRLAPVRRLIVETTSAQIADR